MTGENVEFTNVVSAAPNVHQKVSDIINNNCNKDATILDIGAGEGKVLDRLQKNGFTNLIGVDGATENFKLKDVKIVSHNLNFNFPFEDKSFNAIMSSEVIEHVENPWHFAREISRILRPGGIAVITTPNVNSLLSRLGYLRKGELRMYEEEHYVEWGHISPLNWAFLKRIFEKSGFEIIGHDYNSANNYFGTKKQILVQRVLMFFFGHWIAGELGGDINIITLKKLS